MREVLGQFKIYPRGFLGTQLKERIERTQRLQENNNGFVPVKFSSFKKPNGVDDVNHEVEELYASYIKQSADCTSFEFRNRILHAALRAFGTPNFRFWFETQYQSPVLRDLHGAFLDDTLKFISTGRRDQPLETWAAIISITNNDDGSGKLSEYANEFFGISANGITRYARDSRVIDIVQDWCSKPNGIEDLLGTLHILFGAVN
ncbi:hypothetical protein D3C71_79420 [compost metagenome]